jgi:copper transport protein
MRFVDLVGLSLVAGAATMLLVVWPRFTGASTRRVRVLALGGLGLVVLANAASVVELASMSGAGGMGLVRASLDALVEAQTGQISGLRILISIALGSIWIWWISSDRGTSWLGNSGLVVLTGLLLLGRSLTGHAGSANGGVFWAGIAVDFVHLAAACIWIGGLAALLMTIGPIAGFDRGAVRSGIARFSNLAIASVAAVGLTGLYNAWLNVESVRALTDTGYGRLLILKTGILLPAIGLGTANLISVRLGLLGGIGNVVRHVPRLRSTVAAEVALAVLILLIVAVLSSTRLARDAIQLQTTIGSAPMAMPVRLADETTVTFGVSPNRAGTNTFLVQIADKLGDPVDGAHSALVSLSRLDSPATGDPLALEKVGDGVFSAETDALSVVGNVGRACAGDCRRRSANPRRLPVSRGRPSG